MLINFLIYLMTVRTIESVNCQNCNGLNVRTVLFRSHQLDKSRCWNADELILLFSRKLSQELLPKLTTDSELLLNYFTLCLEIVKEEINCPKTNELFVAAIADTFGGYLQGYGLPLAKLQFYEGLANYKTVKFLYDLQAAFKRILRTDGGNWLDPLIPRITSKELIPKIRFPYSEHDVCEQLLNNTELNIGRKSKRFILRRLNIDNINDNMIFSLPFLDDNKQPAAIAVPFRYKNLFSLTSKFSVNILTRYYTAVVQCLTKNLKDDKNNCRKQLPQFINSYRNWLTDEIMPHTCDVTWYPGFGNVIQLFESISTKSIINTFVDDNKFGIESKYEKSYYHRDDSRMPSCHSPTFNNKQTSEHRTNNLNKLQQETTTCQKLPDIKEMKKLSKNWFYLSIIGIIMILFWLIVVCIYFCHMRYWRRKFCEDEENCSTLKSAFCSGELQNCQLKSNNNFPFHKTKINKQRSTESTPEAVSHTKWKHNVKEVQSLITSSKH